MKYIYIVILLLGLGIEVKATDSLEVEKPKKESWLKRTLRNFTEIDENYVEPQHYNWSAMLQATYNYDIYKLASDGEHKQKLTFAPEPSFKAGPYFGWRWMFFGYTFDLKNMHFGSNKQGMEFSLYAAQVGVDFFWRRTGSDYKIRDVDLGDHAKDVFLEDHSFDGLKVGITGANVYYIFNHKRFSYPAAFAQSTCQKISCGSWMAGIGYLENTLSFDHDKLEKLVEEKEGVADIKLDSSCSVPACQWPWPIRTLMVRLYRKRNEALTSIISISTVSVALVLCGIIPSGMQERVLSSVPIIIISLDSLPIIFLAT